MYKDSPTTDLTAQDGNSLAVLFDLTRTSKQAKLISEGLTKNWNEFGSLAPESPGNISPVNGGLEVGRPFKSFLSESLMVLFEFFRYKHTSSLGTTNGRWTCYD